MSESARSTGRLVGFLALLVGALLIVYSQSCVGFGADACREERGPLAMVGVLALLVSLIVLLWVWDEGRKARRRASTD